MEGLHGETSEVTATTSCLDYYDDIPMSAFLATPQEFCFPNGKRHIDLSVRAKIPLKFLTIIGGTGKADVKTVDCRDLGYRRNLVCKIMKTAPKDKYTLKPLDLEKLRHVHIVAFVATFTYNHRDYALMYPHAKADLGKYMDPISHWLRGDEFCDSHTPLVSKVQDLDLSLSAPARISHLRDFFPCLTEALAYLHKQHVKHKDIKPANILVDRFNSPILADFDLSHRYADPNEVPTSGPTGYTYPYAAPETIENDNRPFQSDTFSLGCVFSEMITLVMGQNLQDFRTHRTNTLNLEGAFHKCIDSTQTWLHRLHDPSLTSALRNTNDNTRQVVPIEGYDHDQAYVMAIKTICGMLNPKAKDRPDTEGLSRSFIPIATRQCTECAKQASAEQALLQTVPADSTARVSPQNPGDAMASEPTHSATHLAPPPMPRPGERRMTSGSHLSPLSSARSILDTGRGAEHRTADQTSASVGERSPSAEHFTASLIQPTNLSERLPLQPEIPSVSPAQSSASPSELPQPANGEADNSGTLSQRQKLLEAIGYDVQSRQWKIHKRADLESRY
jgi:serine/threonine protein kinase